MSNNYRPDNDATAGGPWDVAFLSDRDVSGQIPINFVPHPGVYLTPACFGNGTYDDNSFKECFSNLLASEFRRFVIDVYWDSLNRKFRLCPVELPSPSTNTTAEALAIHVMTDDLAEVYQQSRMSRPPLTARQISADDTSSNSSMPSNTTSSAPTNTTMSPIPTTTSPSGTTLYQIGPYQCSDSLGFDTLVSVLVDYITASSYTIQARLQFVIINMHAASTIEAPTSPSQPLAGSELPSSNELINNYLSELGTMIYTPYLLQNERVNLNNSWFARRTADYFPLLNYFSVDKLASGDLSTPDGWPNENYVQLQQGYRLLMGYGSVDSQIGGYDFGGDNSTIFTPGLLISEREAQLGDTGDVSSGCFYSSTENQISQLNSSWAVSTVMNVDQSILGYAADNLTTCGISPVLNYTLDNRPASIDYEPYQTFGNQALFSWASGEPKNTTEAGVDADDVQWACALMDSTDDYRGHWRVADCLKKHRVACREANQPYLWRLSIDAVPYDAGDDVCTGNTTFDVPRTGLENLYLYHHIQSISTTQSDPTLLSGIWVNFNSIDVDSCWVTTGANGTCPYYEDADSVRQRIILVPLIAALITLCLTALTILVKCNTNRRKSKVRKRGEGGWDYEGVPS